MATVQQEAREQDRRALGDLAALGSVDEVICNFDTYSKHMTKKNENI